jgi:hypothetical protein
MLPRRVYLSASCRNALPGLPRASDPPALIADLRSSVILPSQREYELAFLRAAITDASNLPLFEPSIAVGAANTLGSPAMTTYRVGASMLVRAAETPAGPFTVTTGQNDEVLVRLTDALGGLAAGAAILVPAAAYPTQADLVTALQTQLTAWGAPLSGITLTLAPNGRVQWAPPAGLSVTVSFLQAGATLTWGGPIAAGAVGAAQLSPSALGVTTVHQAVFTAWSNVLWTPEDEAAAPPPVPVAQQAWGDPFFYCSSLARVAAMFSQAWGWVWDDSTSPFVGAPGAPTAACLLNRVNAWSAGLGMTPSLTSRPPVVTWDASAQKFAVTLDQSTLGGTDAYLTPQLCMQATYLMNSDTAYVLQALPCTWLADGTAQLMTDAATVGEYPDGPPCRVLTQELAATGALSPVASIALVSVSMGTDAVAVCPPTTFDANGDPLAASSSDSSLSILTDVSVGGDVSIAQGSIEYAPYLLRWVGLSQTTAPLKQFSVQAYWRHARSGALFPVRLAPGGSFDCLVQFKRLDVPE